MLHGGELRRPTRRPFADSTDPTRISLSLSLSQFKLDHPLAGGRGAQWALEDQDVADDAYCKDPTSNAPPLHSMQGHSAPLGIAFYGADWGVVSECCTLRNATACDEIRRAGGLPCEYANDAFVSFHGSWNRDEPTGEEAFLQENSLVIF